jgi:DNA-binding PadR family transcriptional regulator
VPGAQVPRCWRVRVKLQHFELEILLAMIRERRETYSVPLVLALEKQTGRRVAQAAVFIALSRLETKRLVASRLEEPPGGRVRRYFKVTRQGIAAVKEQRDEHTRLWRGLGRLLRADKG